MPWESSGYGRFSLRTQQFHDHNAICANDERDNIGTLYRLLPIFKQSFYFERPTGTSRRPRIFQQFSSFAKLAGRGTLIYLRLVRDRVYRLGLVSIYRPGQEVCVTAFSLAQGFSSFEYNYVSYFGTTCLVPLCLTLPCIGTRPLCLVYSQTSRELVSRLQYQNRLQPLFPVK